MKNVRVVIVLPYVNSYRVPLLRSLEAELKKRDISLTVAVGKPSELDRLRSDRVSDLKTCELRQVEVLKSGFKFRILPKNLLLADLIIVEHAISNIEGHLLLLLHPKVALWGHGFTITKPQSALARAVQKWMARRAAWYFGYTSGSVERAVSLGVKRERTTSLNNTVVVANSHKISNQDHSANSSAWVAVFIGGLDETKRLEFLIASAREIKKAKPEFKLIVAGDGKQRALIESASREGILEYVGRSTLDALSLEYGPISIIAMPGRVGLVAIDSFAHGIPIVTTNWKYHAPEYEYLDTSNSLTTADSVRAYCAGVMNLMDDPHRLKSLADSARNSLAFYSMSGMVAAYVSGIEGVLMSND